MSIKIRLAMGRKTSWDNKHRSPGLPEIMSSRNHEDGNYPGCFFELHRHAERTVGILNTSCLLRTISVVISISIEGVSMAIFSMNKNSFFSHRIHNLYILFINWLYIFLNKCFWGLQRPQKRVTLIWGSIFTHKSKLSRQAIISSSFAHCQ